MTRPAWDKSNKVYCCKDCQERFIGCHATCEKYIAQNAAHLEEKQREKEIKSVERMMKDYRVRERYRTVRKRKRGLRK